MPRSRNGGGEIHAKNVAHLTIPLEAIKTGRGLARGRARDIISSPGSYGYAGTFSMQGIIFGKRGKDEPPEPLFLLRESVTLPPRPYAEPAAEQVRPEVESSVRRAMASLLDEE